MMCPGWSRWVLIGFTFVHAGVLLTSTEASAFSRRPPQHGPAQPEPAPLPPPDPHGSSTVHLMSYNVHGLDLPVGIDHSRYAQIGRILGERRAQGLAPEIVMVQEAFHYRTQELVTRSGYPYFQRGPGRAGVDISSGLLILSEYPILSVEMAVYGNCGGVDCFAQKGVLLARVAVPGLPEPLEIYDTHLNASYEITPPRKTAAEKIRIRQVSEIHSFMREYRQPVMPAVFGGDFNFNANGMDYAHFVTGSGMKNSGAQCATALNCDGDPNALIDWDKAIDHIFYGAQSASGIELKPLFYEWSFTEREGGKEFSDHNALEVKFAVNW